MTYFELFGAPGQWPLYPLCWDRSIILGTLEVRSPVAPLRGHSCPDCRASAVGDVEAETVGSTGRILGGITSNFILLSV